MKKRIISLMVALVMLLSVMTACSLKITKNIASGQEDVTHKINNHLITINDSILSCQISLDYVVYTLPCKLSEFLDNGWEIDKSFSESYYAFLKKKGRRITAKLRDEYNPSDKFYYDSVVYALEVYAYEASGMNIVLPGGLLFGDNITFDKLKEFYGEPNYITDNSYDDVVYRRGSEHNVILVCFTFNSDGELYSVFINHRGRWSKY